MAQLGFQLSAPELPQVIEWFTDLHVGSLPAARIATSNAIDKILVDMKEILSWPGFGVQYPNMPNPSSAPGQPPAKQSGDYADSWHGAIGTGADEVLGWAGTDADQGRRLENGFIGTDSLGRSYHQAPRPHVDFVVDKVLPLWETELLELAVHP